MTGLGMNELTERQMEVLEMISRGYTTKEIALTLHVAERTVQLHNQEMKRRLGAVSRAHAVRLAFERGLL